PPEERLVALHHGLGIKFTNCGHAGQRARIQCSSFQRISWAFRATLVVHLRAHLVKPARYETKQDYQQQDEEGASPHSCLAVRSSPSGATSRLNSIFGRPNECL